MPITPRDVLFYEVLEVNVDPLYSFLKPGDMRANITSGLGTCLGEPCFFGRSHSYKLPTACQRIFKVSASFILEGLRGRTNRSCKLRYECGIYSIGLCKLARCPCEMADVSWIYNCDRQGRRAKCRSG